MMSFTSFQFVLFLGVVYFINWLYSCICKISNNKTFGIYKTLLLIESYLFIIIADWKTAVSLIVLTIICYLAAIGMCKYRARNSGNKFILICSLILVIGQLCLFKYYDFIAENILMILDLPHTSNNFYVPLGISFFTFSAVSYLVDVYRLKIDAYKQFVDLATYLAFFPKLLSGPIIRPEKFTQQLNKGVCSINSQNLQVGIQMVVWGLFKKMVLADHLSVFVNDVFGTPSTFSSTTCIWAIFSYSLQIYFDFAGYSDMAIGFSKMLGIDIDKNFDLPYISKNVTEFWKRWHISLSSWLQDYVYISLGGNRKGELRKKVNLILTMLIGGLWHGADWTFVLWGGIHGVALVIQKKFAGACDKNIRTKNKCNRMGYVSSVVVTFIFVTITWVFFRANSLSNAIEMLVQAITFKDGVAQIYAWTWLAMFFAICEIAFALFRHNRRNNDRICVEYPILKLNTIRSLVLFFVLVGMTIILAYVGDTAFIYGQF